MLRVDTPPRLGWREAVEAQGLSFHTIDGLPYWDETAYYLFESTEIDLIERATQSLHDMCIQAVDHVVTRRRLGELSIPEPFHRFVEASWERDERSIYGRFDLSYDGSGPPKMLEYNADTPTALLEAAVIQWFWLQDLTEPLFGFEKTAFDQFNSIHEALIEAWRRVGTEYGRNVHFSGIVDEPGEDMMTVAYLRDVAQQAGLRTMFLPVTDVGWNERRRVFTDLRERTIEILFKLYPWEWMLAEPFGRHLPECPMRWLEPPWKMVLSNKAILPILCELFPGSPYLLKADFEPIGGSYVVKPILAREGANVAIVEDGRVVLESDGAYGDAPVVYQEYRPLPNFDGRHPVIGSWIVDGEARGMGIREDDSPITRNTSRFVPHLFRKQRDVRPPVFDGSKKAKAKPENSSGGVHDRWLDPI